MGRANRGNIAFGIDDGSDAIWSDCGRPGSARFIKTFCVHKGGLYAGSHEAGRGEYGHVFLYAGGQNWTDCGAPDKSNDICALFSADGHLHAMSGTYPGTGSLLPLAENTMPGGTLFRYAGGTEWIDCGKPSPVFESYQNVAAELDGHIYAASLYHPGMYRYEGGKEWSSIPIPKPIFAIMCMTAFDGYLYCSAKPVSKMKHLYPSTDFMGEYDSIYRFSETTGWERCGRTGTRGPVYAYAKHFGEMYVGTWNRGETFRSRTGCGAWVNCGGCGCGPIEGSDPRGEIMAMATHNGKLYVGTLPYAEVYRYDGPQRWTKMGQLDHTPDVPIRRTWTAAVYAGRLFFGTLPSGRVFSMTTGTCATVDTELASGWRHVVAVRKKDRLAIYLDSVPAVESMCIAPGTFNLSTDQPLRIGLGGHAYFRGKMRDLRLYRRSLSEDEIAYLGGQRPR